MATRYWIGGTGTWNNTNTANWSLGSGGIGGSMSFNGTNQYVSITTSTPSFKLPSTTTPFTVECWVYPTAQLNGTGLIANAFAGGNSVPFALMGASTLGSTFGSNLCFGFYNGSTWAGITSSTSLTTFTWSHIVATYDGTTATLYLNGTSIGTYTGAWNGNTNPNATFYVGRRHDVTASNPYFTGYMTNARVLIGVGTAYAGSFTTPTQPLSTVQYPGTLMLLLRALNSSTVISDSSGTGYTMFNNGTITWNSLTPFTDTAGYPTSSDVVVFDSNSNATAYTVTIGSGVQVGDVYISGPASGNLSFNDGGNGLTIFGSFISTATGVDATTITGTLNFTPPYTTTVTLKTDNNATFTNTSIALNAQTGNSGSPLFMPRSGSIQLASNVTFKTLAINDGSLQSVGYTSTLSYNLYVNAGSGNFPGGLSSSYGNFNVANTYSSAAQSYSQRSVYLSDSGVTAWTTNYNSKISNVVIRKSTFNGGPFVDIVVTFTNPSDANTFQNYMNTQTGDSTSVGLTGTANNTYGASLFSGAGTWVDFTLPQGYGSTWQQVDSTNYALTVFYGGRNFNGLNIVNSASTSAALTATGSGATAINLTQPYATFSTGLNGNGTTITYPKVVFKSTDTSSYNPLLFGWNYIGTIASDAVMTELVVEGSSTDGYKNLSIRGTTKLNKLTVNTTANQLRRVLIRGWYFGANTVDNTYAQGTLSFTGTNPTVNVSDVDFADMIITGDNISSLTVVRTGNGGGNTINNNFAFTAPQTLYWSGASGGTVEKNTTNWSTTDGGAPTAGLMPIVHDTMKFTDNTLNSGSTITIGNSGWLLPNIDFSSRTLPVTLATGAGDVNVFGNLILSSAVTVTNGGSGTMYIGGSTVNTNNVSIAKAVTIVTPRTVTFTSNFTSNPSYAASATPGLAIYCGTIDIRGITLTTTNLVSGNVLASGPSNPGRAIYTNSSSAINLTRGAYNLLCLSVTDGTFKTPGTTPKVNITGTTSQATVSHYYSAANPTNTFTFDPVDVEFVGSTSMPVVQGWFGNLKLTGTASHTTTLSNSPYMYVRDSFTVLYNASSVGFALYTMPRDGTTCNIIANWVYGSGATGTTGARLSWSYFGHTFSQSTGITKVMGPASFDGGRMELRNGTLDLSNLGSNTKVNSFVSTSNSFTKTFDFRGSQLTGVGNEIGWGAGANTTVLYDSTSKITYSTSSLSCTWTNLAAAKLPPVELTSAVTSFMFWGVGNFASFTASAGITITIMAGVTVYSDKFVFNGTSIKPINIQSYQSGTKAYINHNGGNVYAVGVNFTDIGATGTADFRAYESTATNTSGWVVTNLKRPAVTGFLSFC